MHRCHFQYSRPYLISTYRCISPRSSPSRQCQTLSERSVLENLLIYSNSHCYVVFAFGPSLECNTENGLSSGAKFLARHHLVCSVPIDTSMGMNILRICILKSLLLTYEISYFISYCMSFIPFFLFMFLLFLYGVRYK